MTTSLVIKASPFVCDEYTRFRVRNGMTLAATVPEVLFSNFSLKVVGGDLTVEPDVVFNDVLEQVRALFGCVYLYPLPPHDCKVDPAYISYLIIPLLPRHPFSAFIACSEFPNPPKHKLYMYEYYHR